MSEVVSRVMITCPRTGDAVGAVLRLRPSVFETLPGEYRFRFSRCGEVHAWRREQAWLEDYPRARVDAAAATDTGA